MKKEREEYLDIIRSLGGDYAGREAAAAHVADSDCYVYGFPAPFSFVPAFYTEADLAFMHRTVEMTHRILSKAITHYVENPEYRKLFAFPKKVEDLILLPCNYEEKLPISRFDFFLNEDDLSFKFCEFNTDGTAAMSRTMIGCEAVELTDSFKEFCRAHKPAQFELFDSWVRAFLETYYSDTHARKHPRVLITDFKDMVTMSDVTRYLAAFERAGITARFVDIRELAFDGQALTDPVDGMAFDAVYRRVCTSDIAAHYDECRALIDAVAMEKTVLIGHFRTTVPHAKMINVALRDDQTRAFLTEEEWNFVCDHILPTWRLRTDTPGLDLREIKENKDRWIIKPEDDYDSHGVYAGGDLSLEEWTAVVDRLTDKGFVAMAFHTPCTAMITLPGKADKDAADYGIAPWYSMTGTYAYNGKFVGFFSRMGQEHVISESHHGVSIPSFMLCGE